MLLNKQKNGRLRRAGFSLTELLVVMVIIAMLAGVAAAAVKTYLIRARAYTARIEIANICKAVDSFYAEKGRYPTNAEGLAVLVLPTEDSPTGYLNKLPKDPWKRPYVYRTPGLKGSYDVISLGQDGKEGGTSEAADIRNETNG